MSDEQLQRDIELVDFAMRLESHEFRAAWQRLKPRLTPDRERVAWLMWNKCRAMGLCDAEVFQVVDAAIAAMGETP